ncbi:UDP-3-O-acyl-N-acetylglucosamine deacetylase [Leptospira stimsonii]|uniref:UDP-3-O-(3-hydroxymyristoyl)glucosamine N-acyltransferase n=1 Tax=Leptospira stimsonii TaxID=2202203 RepID=A0ABY2N3J1_9LEPT|nr:UDP-3-O-acyl-N-acetylglucosamine deacetylase [Leptospira stimsonii]TGK22844.1 UDP-3-O-(3-hydroxymyristoyl)glucosamine N-acyltransferase [Leptospira stimsonii]TGM15015.1 UDP-3-O-(3-hydroxymyristoyl)glucosamine N-acyltransferase [Leptospira stimsonii]
MPIHTTLQTISELKNTRFPEIDQFPNHFLDDRFPIDVQNSYTVQKEFSVIGVSTLENQSSTIRVKPSSGSFSKFSYAQKTLELRPEYCIKGNHNIQLGEIKIIEHPIALQSAFGLYLDFELEKSSFPTFDFCDQVYLDGLDNNLQKIGEVPLITVARPFAMSWEKGYCILEPDEGDRKLILDHQVSYPGTTVGNSRIRTEMTPEIFSFIASARTTAFRPGEEAEKFYQIGLAGGLKDYPFTLENVILLNEEKIFNPREKFAHEGKNYEFLAHELIDILAWIRFLEEEYKGRFVGNMTTFLFDHHKQIDIAQFVCDRNRFSEIGMRIL